MNNQVEPLVSIITPVYNGGKYLAECVESVLAQTYQHWEYVIVNNCSSDTTLEIAYRFAAQDKRIKVVDCHEFVDVTASHNRAFKLISPESVYCKVISADDWLYPESLKELVEVGETYPSVGIVGSYTITGSEVRCFGVPLHLRCVSGRQICRLYMSGNYTFNAPSALLYRSSVVRETDPFFPGSGTSADTAACLVVLRRWNFGFVHKILSFERIHVESITSQVATVNAFLLDRIEFLLKYGKDVLSEVEQSSRLESLLSQYYNYLAVAVVHFRGRELWEYHLSRLKQIGLALSWWRLVKASMAKLIELGLNVQETGSRLIRYVSARNAYAEAKAANIVGDLTSSGNWTGSQIGSSNECTRP
jgi:glycosyltransferase involved in cell wall biosynthesis